MPRFFLFEVGFFNEEISNHGHAFEERLLLLLDEARLGGDLAVELLVLASLLLDPLVLGVGVIGAGGGGDELLHVLHAIAEAFLDGFPVSLGVFFDLLPRVFMKATDTRKVIPV